MAGDVVTDGGAEAFSRSVRREDREDVVREEGQRAGGLMREEENAGGAGGLAVGEGAAERFRSGAAAEEEDVDGEEEDVAEEAESGRKPGSVGRPSDACVPSVVLPERGKVTPEGGWRTLAERNGRRWVAAVRKEDELRTGVGRLREETERGNGAGDGCRAGEASAEGGGPCGGRRERRRRGRRSRARRRVERRGRRRAGRRRRRQKGRRWRRRRVWTRAGRDGSRPRERLMWQKREREKEKGRARASLKNILS